MSDQLQPEKNILLKYIRFIKLKKFYFICTFIILFILIISIIVINKNNSNNNLLISEDYNQAVVLLQNKQNKKAKKILLNIIENEHKLYSPLALYLIIEKKLETNKDKILSLYDVIIENNKIDNEDINLIKIKKAIHISNYKDEKQILKILNPIINSESIWRNKAIKLMIDYFSIKNDKIKSEKYLRLLKSN